MTIRHKSYSYLRECFNYHRFGRDVAGEQTAVQLREDDGHQQRHDQDPNPMSRTSPEMRPTAEVTTGAIPNRFSSGITPFLPGFCWVGLKPSKGGRRSDRRPGPAEVGIRPSRAESGVDDGEPAD